MPWLFRSAGTLATRNFWIFLKLANSWLQNNVLRYRVIWKVAENIEQFSIIETYTID